MNATTEPKAWALGDIEPELSELRSMTGLLGHMATSASNISGDELTFIQGRLDALYDRLHDLWETAWDQWVEEKTALEAALKAEKARKAAPVSPQGMALARSMWGIMQIAAEHVLKEAKEAELLATQALEPEPAEQAEVLQAAE